MKLSRFIQLAVSVSFLFVAWIPMEGVPYSFEYKKDSDHEKIYIIMHQLIERNTFGRRYYIMRFLFRK